MKSKKTLLIVALVFVLLIGGAYVLYGHLSQSVSAQQMVVHAQTQPTAAPSENDQEEPEVENAEAASEQEPEVIPAPDFTVYDKAGNEVRLSQYFGKPIVLNFWASWCGPCQSEMPDFNEKYAELGDEVHFVMVNMTDGGRETIETASAFIEKNGYEFPVLFDTKSEAAMTYGAYSLPTSFFINAQGHVVAHAVGAIDGETLLRGIAMITS